MFSRTISCDIIIIVEMKLCLAVKTVICFHLLIKKEAFNIGVNKEELYKLIDALPEEEVETAKRFLEFLATHDPAVHSLYTAPYDDEPTSEEEDLESQKNWEEYLQGNSVPNETATKEIFGE